MLSFVQPGFTVAIDFINTIKAKQAIKEMNELITEAKGKIYLAKDLFLTPEQFEMQYTNYPKFHSILSQFSPKMSSNLSHRLRLT